MNQLLDRNGIPQLSPLINRRRDALPLGDYTKTDFHFVSDRRGRCALCGVDAGVTTHSLVPTSLGGQGDANEIDVCIPCHRLIHETFTRRQLAFAYYTVEALRAAPAIAEAIERRADKILQVGGDVNGCSTAYLEGDPN